MCRGEIISEMSLLPLCGSSVSGMYVKDLEPNNFEIKFQIYQRKLAFSPSPYYESAGILTTRIKSKSQHTHFEVALSEPVS
jgi:hypothetical protein